MCSPQIFGIPLFVKGRCQLEPLHEHIGYTAFARREKRPMTHLSEKGIRRSNRLKARENVIPFAFFPLSLRFIRSAFSNRPAF